MMRDGLGPDKKMPMGSVENCKETAIESEAKHRRTATTARRPNWRKGGMIMSEEFKPRLDYTKHALEPLRSLYTIERYLYDSGIDVKLLHMLKLRASQTNGCAYCIDMHWKDAKAAGETEQRLYGLGAWRESPYYRDKERAALEWTEAVTLVSETHVPDDVYARVRAQYSEKEIVDLTLAVAMINLWNRVAISDRKSV